MISSTMVVSFLVTCTQLYESLCQLSLKSWVAGLQAWLAGSQARLARPQACLLGLRPGWLGLWQGWLGFRPRWLFSSSASRKKLFFTFTNKNLLLKGKRPGTRLSERCITQEVFESFHIWFNQSRRWPCF